MRARLHSLLVQADELCQIDTLEAYHFGTWDFHSEECDRWSINFISFYGRNILEHIDLLVDGDDEMAISYRICEKTGLRES